MSESLICWRKIVRDRWLIAALAALLILKFGIVAVYGPGRQPDTGGYVVFAQQILLGTAWTAEVPLVEQPMPSTVFRSIGYPAVLAAAMAVMPQNWPWLVVGLQIVLSTAAMVLCFALARAFGASRWLAALAVFAAGTSMLLPVDVVLLTDSLAATCLITALGLLTLGAVARRRLHWVEASCIGLLLAAAMLIRDGTAVLASLFLLPLAARLVSVPRGGRWRSAAAAILIFAPMIATSQAYQAWNESRTGYRFLTTGAQTGYLMALVKAARQDPTIFSGSEPLHRAARGIVVENTFAEVIEIVLRLHKEGMSAPEMAATMQRRYFAAWRDHPGAMVRLTLTHLRENKLLPTVRPFGSVRDAILWTTDKLPWPKYQELKQSALRGEGSAMVLFFFEYAETWASLIANYVALIAPPIWLLAFWRPNSRPHWITLSAMSLWGVCLGFLLAHAMVHFEHRYLAPVLPFIVVLAAGGIQGVLDRVMVGWRQFGTRIAGPPRTQN